ncbi:hypothetical protein PoB_004998000 [Plakobranchus ocellatus]|uniref:Secreted protein n=1 Tax=Plakobranchus ocellatus TaxID=259542 RepID=A0AAV4BWJ3_9GAST|nr:hypothetical protein PoB_004998000 [Plakobranchus ocellatus]
MISAGQLSLIVLLASTSVQLQTSLSVVMYWSSRQTGQGDVLVTRVKRPPLRKQRKARETGRKAKANALGENLYLCAVVASALPLTRTPVCVYVCVCVRVNMCCVLCGGKRNDSGRVSVGGKDGHRNSTEIDFCIACEDVTGRAHACVDMYVCVCVTAYICV